MLRVRSDRPVDPVVVSVVREIDTVAVDLRLPYVLVGATAREVLLVHVFGLPPGRATRDVDIAVALASWDEFHQLKQRIIAGGRFVATHDIAHRRLFSPEVGAQPYRVDLLPFGGVEQTPSFIACPPDMHILMNVAGFSEALETAPLVEIETGLMIRVVSLPGLAMIKLFAWQERGLEDSRDATDLVTLCRHYADAGNLERLYEDAITILPTVGYDVELAGAWLLGTDMATTASQSTRHQLQTLLNDAQALDRLVTDMARALRGREHAVPYATELLNQFIRGFLRLNNTVWPER